MDALALESLLLESSWSPDGPMDALSELILGPILQADRSSLKRKS